MRTLLLVCFVLPLSCWPQADTFSVMTYNLRQYALTDRDGGGKPDDPKPENERRVAASLIAKEHPDVLAVQEMGDATVFAQFETICARLERIIRMPNCWNANAGKSIWRC
jgi:hypothetical protein